MVVTGEAESSETIAAKVGRSEDHTLDDFNFIASIRTIYDDDVVHFIDADFDVNISADIGDVTADDLLQAVFPEVSDGYVQPEEDAQATLIDVIERTEAEGDVMMTIGPPPAVDATTQSSIEAVDASTSTDECRQHFNKATQTYRNGQKVLPDGMTMKRLALMLFEAPQTSVADMVFALGKEPPTTMAPSESLDTIEAVLYGMDTMARTIIGFLADKK
jgi:hypothetical protein